ncbi:alpha/beta fold hydrolase [Variovorax sp. dw_308]|uniref:alpha/beta fold hydrolase n=1 Tax=Variovorax sp. dw_308 TaxID=2721546 RepID=UPI001C48258B|nr:alpha/beta fold hydrolase [Variovorax sp. dw_308]
MAAQQQQQQQRQAKPADPAPGQRLRIEVDRMIQRSLKGLAFLGSPSPAVGVSPRTLLHRRGTLSLYHYHATSAETYRVPLLLVMATSNKAAVFDLAKGQSLIQYMLARGYDIYVMDWNAPTREESHLRIEDYVLDFIPDCIRRVQQDCGEDDVTVIGYCMGGVLSTIYAALHPDGPLKNLVLFTTPTDWRKTQMSMSMTDKSHFDVDRLVNSLGLIPPEAIITAMDLQRPASRVVGQIRLWDNMWNDDYVKGYRMMDRWGADTLPMAGEYFRQLIKEFVWKNGLHEGTLRIGGQPVLLKNIKVPLLHIIAQHDHLVPPACAQPLAAAVSSQDKQEVILPGGHVSLVAGPNAVKRMWPALDQWLGERSV